MDRKKAGAAAPSWERQQQAVAASLKEAAIWQGKIRLPGTKVGSHSQLFLISPPSWADFQEESVCSRR